MLDLRPKLAREFAEAIMDDVGREGLPRGPLGPKLRQEILSRWVDLILDRFISHDIPFPGNEWVSTHDQPTCEKFLDKYPDLRRLDALCREEALRRWPEATFSYRLHSDPESGHVTCEGQSIRLEIQTGLDFYGPDGEKYPENSPYSEADAVFMDWLCDDDSPYQKICGEIGDMHFLFATGLQWKPEPGDEDDG